MASVQEKATICSDSPHHVSQTLHHERIFLVVISTKKKSLSHRCSPLKSILREVIGSLSPPPATLTNAFREVTRVSNKLSLFTERMSI